MRFDTASADGCHSMKSGIANFLTLFAEKYLIPFNNECGFSRKVAPNWQVVAVIAAQK